ncbi:MAG: MTH938/NDUFAF3 family protein [Janthinobacterium lividum]
MDITPVVPPNINMISGYGISGFKVNSQLFVGNIILSANTVNKWVINNDIQSSDSYSQIIKIIEREEAENMILLIGTGREVISPLSIPVHLFIKRNVSPEIMSTPAACRTYNILISEQRHVYALLIGL